MVASVVAVGAVVVSVTVDQVSMAAIAVSKAIAIVVVRVGFSISSRLSFRGSFGVCSPLAVVVSSTVVAVGAVVVSMAIGKVTMTVSEAVSEAVSVVVVRVSLRLSSSCGLRCRVSGGIGLRSHNSKEAQGSNSLGVKVNEGMK